MLEGVPDKRLDDVRTYLEQLGEADAAWMTWEERYGGPAADEHIRAAVQEADTDPRPSVAHKEVAAWLRTWVSDDELPPPI